MNTLLKKRRGEMPRLFPDWFDSNPLFGPMFGEMNSLLPRQPGVNMPTANIKETDTDYLVELATPGFERDELKVELDENMLTIWSEKQDEQTDEKDAYSRREFSYSAFSRSFTLPENSLGEKIDAQYKDGVLRVRIPKNERVPQRTKKQISIT